MNRWFSVNEPGSGLDGVWFHCNICSFKPTTYLYLLQLQNPAGREGMTSLGHSRSVNVTNLMWFHQHSSSSLHPSPSEEPFCDFLFQRMLPKWRLGERCYSPGCSDDMQRSLLWAPRKRGGDEQEVVWVRAFFFPLFFYFHNFSDPIWCESTNWPLVAAPCVHNRTH